MKFHLPSCENLVRINWTQTHRELKLRAVFIQNVPEPRGCSYRQKWGWRLYLLIQQREKIKGELKLNINNNNKNKKITIINTNERTHTHSYPVDLSEYVS